MHIDSAFDANCSLGLEERSLMEFEQQVRNVTTI